LVADVGPIELGELETSVFDPFLQMLSIEAAIVPQAWDSSPVVQHSPSLLRMLFLLGAQLAGLLIGSSVDALDELNKELRSSPKLGVERLRDSVTLEKGEVRIFEVRENSLVEVLDIEIVEKCRNLISGHRNV